MIKLNILPVIVMISLVLFAVGLASNVYGDDSSTTMTLVSSDTIASGAVVSYTTQGGFINPKFSVRELNITPDTKTYTIYDSDGNVTRSISIPIDSAEYAQLIDTLNANNFVGLNDAYGGNNPDVGNSKLSVVGSSSDNSSNIDKTVTVSVLGGGDNQTLQAPPETFGAITDELGNISSSITNPAVADFTQYGYNTIYTASITANDSSDFTAGPFEFSVPAGTFSDDVQIDVLQADPSTVAAYAPNSEVPIQTFALRVQDVNNGSLITDFAPINVTVNDGNITSDATFYDVAPDDTYSVDNGSMSAVYGTLTATLDTARTAWAITEPGPIVMNESAQSSNTASESAVYYSLKQSATIRGHILIDSSGMTVYTFSLDSPYNSVCNGSCAVAWPPMIVGSGVTPIGKDLYGNVGVILRTDGQYQVTYDGSPLYYFSKDMQPGDTNGDNIYGFNGTWSAVYLDGENKAQAPMTSSY